MQYFERRGRHCHRRPRHLRRRCCLCRRRHRRHHHSEPNR